MNKPLILLVLFLCSCNFNREINVGSSSIEINNSIGNKNSIQLDYIVNGDSIWTIKEENGALMNYKFNRDSTGFLLKSIDVFSNNIKIQEIIANKEMLDYGHFEKQYQLIDWNFDGFYDITVLYNCGSGGCAYWIWNYSQIDDRYYYNSKLSERLGLEIDTKSNYIINHYRAGWQEEWWDTLSYENEKLKFVKGLYREQYVDSNGIQWKVDHHRSLVNDSIIYKRDSTIVEYLIRKRQLN